jgi:hypothetical protein
MFLEYVQEETVLWNGYLLGGSDILTTILLEP